MVVWAVTMPILVVALSQLVGNSRVGGLFVEWRWTILAVWYAVVIAAIGIRFSDYWATLVP